MKYDFDLDLESRNSLSLLIKRISSGSTVLEFGTANGRMTKYLKEDLGCRVYGVELDAEAAKEAALFSEKIVVGDIEEYAWREEFSHIEFDFIVFGDVLEHLYDPNAVLKSVWGCLKEDGSVLISVPNVAHNSILINLMKNEFNYSATGLLDNTHIRFYTKKTFDALVEECGYFISYESGVYSNPADTEFQNSYEELPSCVGEFLAKSCWGELYQLIYELKKTKTEIVSEFSSEFENFGTKYLQLFVDTGAGFNEKESLRVAYRNQRKVVFDLCGFGDVLNVRFDPLDSYGFVRIDSIVIDNFLYEGLVNSNAFLCEDGIYYFDNTDPSLYFEFENKKKISNISFELEFLSVGQEAAKRLSEVYKRVIKEKVQIVYEQNSVIKEQAKSLRDKHFFVQDMEEEIVRLHGVAQSMRIKNRIARVLPRGLKDILKEIVAKIRFLQYRYKKFRFLAKANGTFFVLRQIYKSRRYKSEALSFSQTKLDLDVVESVKEKISIIIPTYNGLLDLVKLIPNLINQKGFESVEIIIVDSSSSDGTKEFVEKFDAIEFVSIEQKDFSHSYARNLGYEKSSGEYVLFLVQDALPTSEMWLYNFYGILRSNELVALSCTQVVNAEADLYSCYGIDSFNKYLELDKKRTKITEKFIDDVSITRKLVQLDNVACFFDASEFGKYRFRGKYAEDLDMGQRLVKDSKRIATTSEVSVIHSHLRPAYYYMKRALVETDVLNSIFEQKERVDICIINELGDIYGTAFLIGEFLADMRKLRKFPIGFEFFRQYGLEKLSLAIDKEYIRSDFKKSFDTLSSYDKDLADTIALFDTNQIEIVKGTLYYSIYHFVDDCFAYIEKRYSFIDEKLLFEFCLFVLKVFATNCGVKLGTHKKQYESSDIFIANLVAKLQKGI